jgi:hypothetical protein
MYISQEEIPAILNDFPNFELSYETMAHKKVYNSDVILAIPEGNKCFAWFTSYKKDNVCFVLEIGQDKRITNIQIFITSFTDSLALGSIFYGTFFSSQQNNSKCFCIEDIYYYKGKNISNKNFLEKLYFIKDIFANVISQMALTDKYLIFGVPLMNNNFNNLLKEIELLPYKIGKIQFRFFNDKKIQFIKYYKPRINVSSKDLQLNMLTNAIFKITPDVQNDIYNLYVYNNGKEDFYDVAFIPDFKTSVMMNSLFRNIKENNNLDALEESDDENEFENERIDKYVFLDRSYKMHCEYNFKFKKWIPISLAKKHERIVTSNLLVTRSKFSLEKVRYKI